MESRIRSQEEQKLIDAKIAEIKKKEQLIKKRQQEIEEDKRLAEEQNAVVNLKPAVDDWLPEKTPPLKPSSRVSFGEVEEMNPAPKQMQYRGRGRGRRYDDQKVGGPPPDPVSFLADPERDYQPRTNRQEVPPKNFNENWRGEEKRPPPKPGRTEQGDWRGEKQKNVERNWREDATDLCSRDDRGSSGLKSASMQQDWRRPQAPSQGQNFHQTNSLNEDRFAEVDQHDHCEQSNIQMRNNPQYLHGPNDSAWDPNDLRSKLMSKKNEIRGQTAFTDDDSWHSKETSSLPSSSKLPSQNFPEPVRQTAFDTLPAASEVLSAHTLENDSHSQNNVYYSNSNSISHYKHSRRVPEPSQVSEVIRRAPDTNQVYEATLRASETNQMYCLADDDHWEDDEKCFLNQSKMNYGQDPSGVEFKREEIDGWNYYQDRSSQGVNAGGQFADVQGFVEPSNLQSSDRGVKAQTFITNNGQLWNQVDSQRTISHDPEPHVVGNYQTSQGVCPAGHEAKPPIPFSHEPKPYSNELQYEQAQMNQMRSHVSKPPNPVYPANFDNRHTSLNQQILTVNSGNVRQSSALNTGRPDDAYAYFQAKMAKAQSHHSLNLSEVDELQGQFAKMYHTAPPDRRVAPGGVINQAQFAEINNANRQPLAYATDSNQWSQVPEKMAPPMQNQTKHSINDRLRRSQEQAILAPHHVSNPQRHIHESRNQMEYLQAEAMKHCEGLSEHDGYVGHSVRRGAEVSCQTEEPLLVQNYPSQIEARHSTNISQRSHPTVTIASADNYAMPTATDRYLNAQYDSPPPVKTSPQLNNYSNGATFENRSIPRQSMSQHGVPSMGQNWTAQNAADIRQFAEQASNLNRNAQPQLNAHHISEQPQRNAPPLVVREASQIDNESLLAFQNELVAHATDRIQARVNSALNDRLKRARDAALQERFEPPPLYPPNQMPNMVAASLQDGQRPAGRAIKGCQSQASNAHENQLPKPGQSTQFDNWQIHESDSGQRINRPSINVPPPSECYLDVSRPTDNAQPGPQGDPLPDEPAQPIEITLPTCLDLSKPPPLIFPSEEITAKIFSSPPPKIPELNPDSEDVDNLIAKPYYQYKSPTNQDFRPKLTFSLEKKGLEKAEIQNQSTAASSSLPSAQNDRNTKQRNDYDKMTNKNNKSSQPSEDVVVEKRITAAERVAKLLETPIVLPDYTPSYVLKVLGEEEIRNIKSRTTGNSRNAQNVGS